MLRQTARSGGRSGQNGLVERQHNVLQAFGSSRNALSICLPPGAALLRPCLPALPCREVSLVALLGFLAYLIGEELHLSGIFSVFFCGITMR